MKKRILLIVLCIVVIGGIGYKLYDRYFYFGEIVGIKGTFTYHRANCMFVKKSSAKDLTFFEDLADTAYSDYRPCKTCRPPDNADEVRLYEKELALEAEQKEAEAAKQKEIEEMEAKNKKAADKSEMLEYLSGFEKYYDNGIFTWPKNVNGLAFKVFAGLINNNIIPKDSKLCFENEDTLNLILATGTFSSQTLPNDNENQMMMEQNCLSSDNTFLAKLIADDEKYGINKKWYTANNEGGLYSRLKEKD